jgi:hypothetical protein
LYTVRASETRSTHEESEKYVQNFVEEAIGNRSLEKPRRSWDGNIKMDRGGECGGKTWD